jgi:GntR family transcriptional regulator
MRRDGTPLYVQLATTVRRKIADGSWDVGHRLPTLKQLVTQFGVSPMTVRAALAGLEQEGLISAQRGRGTFVTARPDAPAAVPYDLTALRGSRGSALTFRLIAARPAADELRVQPEDGLAVPPYHYMKRIFARAGRSFMSGEYFIASAAYASVPERRWRKELVSVVLHDTAEMGLRWVRQRLRVVAATPREADELGLSLQDSVMQVRRIFLNDAGEVLCLAQLAYRADGVVFDINIEVADRTRLMELGGFPE